MTRYFFGFFGPFAAALIMSVVHAAAEGGRPGPETPWSVIAPDPRATTSRCIGEARTPLCAVETLLACFQWNRPDLCRMVDDDEEQYAGIFTEPADPGKYLAYRVVAERSPVPGREVEIDIEQQEIAPGQVIGPATEPPDTFHLRRQPDGRWKIVGWGDVDHG